MICKSHTSLFVLVHVSLSKGGLLVTRGQQTKAFALLFSKVPLLSGINIPQ